MFQSNAEKQPVEQNLLYLEWLANEEAQCRQCSIFSPPDDFLFGYLLLFILAAQTLEQNFWQGCFTGKYFKQPRQPLIFSSFLAQLALWRLRLSQLSTSLPQWLHLFIFFSVPLLATPPNEKTPGAGGFWGFRIFKLLDSVFRWCLPCQPYRRRRESSGMLGGTNRTSSRPYNNPTSTSYSITENFSSKFGADGAQVLLFDQVEQAPDRDPIDCTDAKQLTIKIPLAGRILIKPLDDGE